MLTLSLHWLVLALDTSIKAALLAALAALALRYLHLRDRIWTGVLFGMLLLPLLARTIPALRLPLPLNLDRLIALQLDEPLPIPTTQASPPSVASDPDPQEVRDILP